VADFRYLNLRIGIAYLFQTAFEDAGDALFRGELDPRWLMGLWEEWAAVVRNSAKGRDGSAKDDDEPVMVDVYSGLLADLEKLKGTTIKQIGLSSPFHTPIIIHAFTRTHALSFKCNIYAMEPNIHTYPLTQQSSRTCP